MPALAKVDRVSRLVLDVISSKWFLRLAFAWFILQAVYFAITVRYGLPPDENYHYSYVQLFAKHFPSPLLPDQNHYGIIIEAVRNPFFLYHYLLGLVYFFFKNLRIAA